MLFFKKKERDAKSALILKLNGTIDAIAVNKPLLTVYAGDSEKLVAEKTRASDYLERSTRLLKKCCEELEISLGCRDKKKQEIFFIKVDKAIDMIDEEIRNMSFFYSRIEEKIYPMVQKLAEDIRNISSL